MLVTCKPLKDSPELEEREES